MNELNEFNALQADGEYFTLNEYTALEANVNTIDSVLIIAPTEGQEDFVRTSAIDWEAFRSYTRYRVRLATDAEFATVVETVDVDATEVAGIIDNAGGYWAKVTPLEVVSPTPPEPEATIDSVTITGGETLQQNGTRDLVADVQKTGDIDDAVTWESSNEAVATVQSTGSKSARVTYVSGDPDDTVTITAKAVEDDQVSDDQILTITAEPSVEGSRAQDEQVLSDFYTATNGADWKIDDGWNGGNVSLSDDPYGVRIEEIGEELRVTGIQMNGSATPEQTGIDGGNGLTGSLPNTLNQLSECTYLNVMFNALGGPLVDMPPKIEYMYLNGPTNSGRNDPHIAAQSGSGVIHPSYGDTGAQNKYNSPCPSSYESLTNLKWIWIPWAGITGNIPDLSASGANLEGINFWSNPFQNTPVPDMFQYTPNISHIIIGKFGSGGPGTFSGNFPTMTGLTKLVQLNMKRTELFSAQFPDLQQSTEIVEIFLTRNNINGDFPAYLLDGTLPRLLALYVNVNNITGSFPANIPRLYPIRVLVFTNNDIGGSIPDSLWINNDSIINTDFDGNQFEGQLLQDMTGQDRIRNFRFANCNLSGPWPTFRWGTSDVEGFSYFHLNGNRFVFSDMLWIPTEFNPENKTIFQLYNENVPSARFSYGNQKRFGSEDNLSGDIIDFSSIVTHADNVYEWYRNGVLINDETTASIDTSEYGAGEYELRVTNPGVSGLTILSNFIEVL